MPVLAGELGILGGGPRRGVVRHGREWLIRLKAKPDEPDTSRRLARSQQKETRMSKGKSMKKEQKKPKKKR